MTAPYKSIMDIEFKLIEKDHIKVILPLLKQHDPSIPGSVLSARLLEMLEKGYECLGIYQDSELIGLCGIWVLVKYYVGRHIELDNVYIKEGYRDLNIGKKLNSWLEDFALSRDCEAIELNCYSHNMKGRNFWETNEYQPIGIHYQKKLNS